MASIPTPGTPHFHHWHCDTVLLVSCFDHWENLLLSLLLWAFPLPIHLTWDYQTSFLKCHFHFVNLQFKPWILSGNLWEKARSSWHFRLNPIKTAYFLYPLRPDMFLDSLVPFLYHFQLTLSTHYIQVPYHSEAFLAGCFQVFPIVTHLLCHLWGTWSFTQLGRTDSSAFVSSVTPPTPLGKSLFPSQWSSVAEGTCVLILSPLFMLL